MEVTMKKITDKYTNNTFENIKHIDDYGNEFWLARELQKVLEYHNVPNCLNLHLSELSEYRIPSMEALYETARV